MWYRPDIANVGNYMAEVPALQRFWDVTPPILQLIREMEGKHMGLGPYHESTLRCLGT